MNTRFNQRVYDVLMEGYTTGGPGTGYKVGRYVMNLERGGRGAKTLDAAKAQIKRIYRRVVKRKTKSTGGQTPDSKTQVRRGKDFITTYKYGKMGLTHLPDNNLYK